MVPTSYEGSDDNEEVAMVPEINQNSSNNYNGISDSKTNDNAKENVFDKDFDNEFEATPKPQ